MAVGVDASTISAAQLFSTSTFTIPDFQREYSWGPEGEVEDFWRDLRGSLESPPYFLGLLIVTDEDERRVVVDGQQRITTLTLLANSIRKLAVEHKKSLIADNIRDVFLFHLDYDTEERRPRIQATAARDSATLNALLSDQAPPPNSNKLLLTAQRQLEEWLREDLIGHEPGARLAKWARFISGGLTFALFEHPNRNSAYKVYEVVNTRGRDLTPAELIKSYLISRAAAGTQEQVYTRWSALEEPFLATSAGGQFTQFVRHIVTLSHGYVIPRDLYQVITEEYMGSAGVEVLLSELEEHADTYLQLVDPSSDDKASDEATTRSFAILHALGLRTVRPIFLAASETGEAERALTELIRVVVPRLTMGTFGTGSIERRFAADATRIHNHENGVWEETIAQLRADLAPSRRNFQQRVAEEALPKGLISVIRSSVLEQTTLPSLEGYVHQIRPKNADHWPGFDDAAYKLLGGTIGNSLLLKTERRPRNTNTISGAKERLFPARLDLEDRMFDFDTVERFSSQEVEELNATLAVAASEVWYGQD